MVKRSLLRLGQAALLLGACKLGDPPRPEGSPPGPVTGEPFVDAALPTGATLVVQVVDANNAPIPKTLIVVDIDGKHVRGAVAVADGIARIPIPEASRATLRTYFEGFQSVQRDVIVSKPDVPNDAGPGTFIVKTPALTAAQAQAVPRVLAFDAKGADGGARDEATAGSTLDIEANLAAAGATDPLSPSDVLVIQPNGFLVTPLAPPAGATDGVYRGSAAVSVVPGTYNYYLVLRTQGGVSSATRVISLTGRSTKPDVILRGRVVTNDDAATPLPDTLITLETSQAYERYNDTSRPSPYYQFGGITNEAGVFDIPVPRERLGIHTFADGFLYGGKETLQDPGDAGTDDAGFLVVKHTAIGALSNAKPTATGFAANPSTVTSGSQIVFTATVNKGPVGTDPLSDEIIIVQPETHIARMMRAPTPGVQSQAFPDGIYTLELKAPPTTTTQQFKYYLVYTSEGCVVGDKKEVTVTVNP